MSPAVGCVHKACPSRDHDVLDARQRLKLGAASQHRRLIPDTIVFKEVGLLTISGACTMISKKKIWLGT